MNKYLVSFDKQFLKRWFIVKKIFRAPLWCFSQFGTIFTIKKNVKNTYRGVILLVKLQA